MASNTWRQGTFMVIVSRSCSSVGKCASGFSERTLACPLSIWVSCGSSLNRRHVEAKRHLPFHKETQQCDSLKQKVVKASGTESDPESLLNFMGQQRVNKKQTPAPQSDPTPPSVKPENLAECWQPDARFIRILRIYLAARVRPD